MIVICKEMGWTYWEYMSQPIFFIEAVKDFMYKEQQAKLKAIKDSQRKHSR